jgi:hypothetical protein
LRSLSIDREGDPARSHTRGARGGDAGGPPGGGGGMRAGAGGVAGLGLDLSPPFVAPLGLCDPPGTREAPLMGGRRAQRGVDCPAEGDALVLALAPASPPVFTAGVGARAIALDTAPDPTPAADGELVVDEGTDFPPAPRLTSPWPLPWPLLWALLWAWSCWAGLRPCCCVDPALTAPPDTPTAQWRGLLLLVVVTAGGGVRLAWGGAPACEPPGTQGGITR